MAEFIPSKPLEIGKGVFMYEKGNMHFGDSDQVVHEWCKTEEYQMGIIPPTRLEHCLPNEGLF